MVRKMNPYDSTHLYREALKFAAQAHGEQKRKYTGEPYIVHPVEVAEIVRAYLPGNEVARAVALLHDVLEDTPVTYDQMHAKFGPWIVTLVSELTDVSRKTDGNRKLRKQMDLEHLATACALAQTVKVADIMSNSESIFKYAPKFAKVYLPEKAALLQALTKADPLILRAAEQQMEQYGTF